VSHSVARQRPGEVVPSAVAQVRTDSLAAVVFDGHPTVIGHRGSGSGEVDGFAENTLSSFLHAVEAGVPWIEVDVRRTSDDRLVVRHNAAYADGTKVVDVDSAEAARRGSLWLDDLLSELPDGVGIDFDLKTAIEDSSLPAARATVGLVASVAAREAARRPVAVVSFDPAAVLELRELAPGVGRGWTSWLRFPSEHAVAGACHFDVDFLGLHMGSLTSQKYEPAPTQRNLDEIVGRLHDAGRELLLWCPSDGQIRRAVAIGVDAICVNEVPTVLADLARGGADISISAS
jgi:glycerophosphoryl diester phosphodiesterase